MIGRSWLAGVALTGVVLAAAPAMARTWTDVDGNTTTGEFVRVHRGRVVLMRGGRVKLYPFQVFCAEDRRYIREQMGEEAARLLPPPAFFEKKNGEVPGNAAPGMPANPASGNEPRGAMDEPAPSAEGQSLPWFARSGPTPPPAASSPFEPAEQVAAAPPSMPAAPIMPAAPSTPVEQYEPPENLNAEPQYEPMPAAGPPARGPRTGPPAPPKITPPSYGPSSSPPMMEQTWVGYCTNCNQEVSAEYGAGDHCPHCGVFFMTEEMPDGSTKRARGPKAWGYSIGVGGFILIVSIFARLFMSR